MSEISGMDQRFRVLWAGIILAFLLVLFTPLPVRPGSEPVEHTIRVSAQSFEFSPGEIFVNQGDRVNIELTSLDVVHGLYLDGYGLQVIADPGKTNKLSFTAGEPGTFRFRCSVTCGALHPFMIGKLHVGPNILLWRAVGLVFVTLLGTITLASSRFRSQIDE